MAVKAYVLISTSVGNSRRVQGKLRAIPAVKSVDTVTGPYDIIALAATPDLTAVGDLITTAVHTIDGISRTVTCLSFEER